MQITATLSSLRADFLDALHDQDHDLAAAILATIQALKAQS